MPGENPYPYEGTAESLDHRPLPPKKRSNIQLAAIPAAIAAALSGSIAAGFLDLEVIGVALILTLFVFLPIGIYCWKYAATGNQKAAFIAFGIAAAPLQCVFLLLILQGGGGGEAAIAREIGLLATFSYGLQLLAASLTLLIVTEW